MNKTFILDEATGLITIEEQQHTILTFGRHLYNYGISEVTREHPLVYDSIVAIGDFAGSGSCFYAIYEGHGGYQACEYAGQNVHRVFSRDFTNDVTPQSVLKDTLKEVSDHIAKSYPDEGCSAAIVMVMKNIIYAANLGDTRIMLIDENGDISFLSEYHSTKNSSEGKEVYNRTGYINHSLVCDKSPITRSLGDGGLGKIISHEPFMKQIRRHDRMVVIIGTNDLFQSLDEKRLARMGTSHVTATAAAKAITNEALKKDPDGNHSCLVLSLTPK